MESSCVQKVAALAKGLSDGQSEESREIVI